MKTEKTNMGVTNNLVTNLFNAVMNLRKSSDEVNLKKFIAKVDGHLTKYVKVKKAKLAELNSDLKEWKEEKRKEADEKLLVIDEDKISSVEGRNEYVGEFVDQALRSVTEEKRDIRCKEIEIDMLENKIKATEELIDRLCLIGE